MKKAIAGAALAAAIACACLGVQRAEAVTIGYQTNNYGGNCAPFGCNASTFGDQSYLQVYSSLLFSGKLDISTIAFFNYYSQQYADQDPSVIGLQTGFFVISLSTTDKPVNGLVKPNSANIGSDAEVVFSGKLPSLENNVLALNLSQDFLYDPTKGNLLLTVQSYSDTGQQGYLDTFDANHGEPIITGLSSRINGSYNPDTDYGLVTGFYNGPVDVGAHPTPTSLQPVPLPSSAPLFGAGLIALSAVGYGLVRKGIAAAAS